jgi:SET domain-containing protein
MSEYYDCSKVYLDKSSHGFGVYASKDIKKDEIIEKGIMTPLINVDGNVNPRLLTWSDDRKTWATGSGLIPFYNHDDIPNIKKVGDLKNNTMLIIALVDIKKGTELRNTYFSKKWRTCFQDF